MNASDLTLDSAISSWDRALRARNRSPKTIRSYIDTARLLEDFLRRHQISDRVRAVKAEHVELLIQDQLRRWRPTTAAVRHRSLQQFFGWLVSQNHIEASPMATMQAPRVPAVPVPVIPDEDLRSLLGACRGPRFEDTRDEALLRVMIETGVRLSEVAGLAITDIDLVAWSWTCWVKAEGVDQFPSGIALRSRCGPISESGRTILTRTARRFGWLAAAC